MSGGALELFDENMNNPVKKILPQFNTAIIFTTTSTSYHGHPDPLKCPKNYRDVLLLIIIFQQKEQKIKV